ncbi:MAG: exo-1,3-beta-glucanase [Watsoniomyces obsoletus]|nr:MAG: exo-1,3-beta-glucanase [Watsoniomyces obsoletus]
MSTSDRTAPTGQESRGAGRRSNAHSGAEAGGAPSDSSRLEEQAASAALYHTPRSGSSARGSDQYPLDEDQKLSAAGAAASLKYAKPQDLPSYPVLGLSDNGSSAGAAASLANAHHRSFEHWKPDPSASASAAAVLAKDYKMQESWHPEHSKQGSRAATLAAKEGAHVNVWRPTSTEWGHSAALQAARAGEGLSPQLDRGYTAEGHRRSLQASTLAMSGGRQRAGSTPVKVPAYPDAANASYNALNAASAAHASRPMIPDAETIMNDLPPALKASRYTHVGANVPREMFGSHPPVGLEVEEKRKTDALHSAAVSMARQMYEVQQKAIVGAAGGGDHSLSTSAANRVHGRPAHESTTTGGSAAPMRVTNLEEAARRLAAERLAKLQDEHVAYRDYYGTNAPRSRSSLSLRSRPRRRLSSADEEDEARSLRIRAEMSIFKQNVAEVDPKKRQQDRDALMAAAQRNVRASLHDLDERVFTETGKVPPSLMDEWEAKARATAEADSKTRMANYGRVNIGGGKYLERSEVDAVAARNVQPVLDDINDKAEGHRARQEELRLDKEQEKRRAEEEKLREKEVKVELKKARGEWSTRAIGIILVQSTNRKPAAHDKEAERARKREEKAKRAEEKRRIKEEKQRAKEAAKATAAAEKHTAAAAGTGADVEAPPERPSSPSSSELSSDSDLSSDVEELSERRPLSSDTPELTTGEPVVVETTETVTSVITQTIRKKPQDAGRLTKAAGPSEAVADESAGPDTQATELREGDSKATTDSPSSPKGESRVKSWLKEKFARRASKGQKDKDFSHQPGTIATATTVTTGTTTAVTTVPTATISHSPERRASSVRDVAMVGRGEDDNAAIEPTVSPTSVTADAAEEERQSRPRRRSPSPPVSPLSDYADDEATMGLSSPPKETYELSPPPVMATQRTADSPVRDSKFLENL